MPKYPQEQIWKIYEQIPKELKEAIFSQETADNIWNVCENNGIEELKQISEVARLTGEVLLGLLSPDEFQNALEEELSLKPEMAKKIAFGIQRFIFWPLRASLSVLYQMEIKAPGIQLSEGKVSPKAELKAKTARGKDVYREPIE